MRLFDFRIRGNSANNKKCIDKSAKIEYNFFNLVLNTLDTSNAY